jgi:hypothetical protein
VAADQCRCQVRGLLSLRRRLQSGCLTSWEPLWAHRDGDLQEQRNMRAGMALRYHSRGLGFMFQSMAHTAGGEPGEVRGVPVTGFAAGR